MLSLRVKGLPPCPNRSPPQFAPCPDSHTVFLAQNTPQAALFGISVAVGLTPEMLPMVVNANLARGAVAMAHQRAIVKRLDAVQV